MTRRPIRIGFVGGHGHHYLRGALQDPGLSVEAAACGDGVADDAARQKHRESAWYDGLPAMLDRFEPDVLSVGAVYALNGRAALQGLERGVPVVSDKPVAADWETLEQLTAAVERTGAALITEFDFRSRATFRAARDAVRAGRIGRPVLVSTQKSYRWGNRADFYKDRALYGSTLLWIASHGIDVVRFVTGLDLLGVVGRHGNLSRPDYPGTEDHCAVLLRLSDGATGLVHADLLRPAAAPTHGDDRLRLVGTDGQLEVRDGVCRVITGAEEEHVIEPGEAPAPLHRELLAAALDGDTRVFSTAESLLIARWLLAGRDAADAEAWREVGGR